jgi:hemoglobin
MRASLRAWLVVPCLLALALPVRADDKPLARADLDARLEKILLDATSLGVQLFNGGDPAGCYRVYQTSLMSVAPLLDHRPAMQTMIRDELKKAEGMRSVSDSAFALRKVIDKAREDLVAGKMMMAKTLWDRLGGEPAVRKVVSEFLAAAAPDPKVNISRNGKFQIKPEDVTRIEQRLVELISSVTGGPLKYTGKNMKDAHKGMGITDDEFDAAAGHLIDVLKKNNVPQKEIDELVGIIASTRKDMVEIPRGAMMKKLLWDRLGGEPAVTAVIDDFVARAAGDPKVNFTRKGTDTEWEPTAKNVALLKKRLVQLVSAVSGGPLKYEGRDMKSAHMGMKITDAEFNALAGHLKATLDKFKVPEAEQQELLGIIGGTRKDIVEVK